MENRNYATYIWSCIGLVVALPMSRENIDKCVGFEAWFLLQSSQWCVLRSKLLRFKMVST